MTCLKNKLIVTRKSHMCFGCERVFNRGTRMTRRVTIERHENPFGYYLCHKCDEVSRRWGDHRYGQGELRDFWEPIGVGTFV